MALKVGDILKRKAEIKYGLRDENGKLTAKGKKARINAKKKKEELQEQEKQEVDNADNCTL